MPFYCPSSPKLFEHRSLLSYCTVLPTPGCYYCLIRISFFFRKAMKLLGIGIQLVNSPNTSETTTEDSWVNYINSLYLNNLGCLHLLMKKPNLGVFYLNQGSDNHSQALALMRKSCGNAALPMHFLLRLKRNEMCYNSAMNLLHAGQPALAFKTFLAILNGFALMPNIWLR